MQVIRTSIAVLLMAATAGNSAIHAAEPDPSTGSKSAEALAQFKQRWKLQLLPDRLPAKLPDMGLHLIGTTWGQRGPRNILGRGTDRLITVTGDQDSSAPREIVFTTIQHHSVNTQIPATETTKMYPATITSPFLEYDGLIHTAFMTADRKKFIPDAVLRVAGGTWYQVTSRKLPDQNGVVGGVEVTEYLLKFDDDPVRNDTGHLMLHRHIRKLNEPAGETTRLPTNFALFRHSGDDSQPYEVQIGLPGQRSLTIYFYAGLDYAVPEGDRPSVPCIYSLEEIE
ncbi:MAG: hypothetical protein JSS49_07515 [Planctomycetes bacterium]|nr:hypothetical protein [Planctomycetota bacterium]